MSKANAGESSGDVGRREHWEGIYGRQAAEEVSWYQPRPSSSVDLIGRIGKGAGAGVIDVGGGASRLVDALLDAGLTQLAVLDVAETALGRAKARLGERASLVRWIVADVTQWTPDGTFDIWHDRAMFHFLVHEQDRRAYCEVVRSAVPAGGQVIIGTFAPDGPERCSGLPVVRYEAAALGAELGSSCRLLDTLAEEHVTPRGKVQRFQFCRFLRV